MVTPGTDGGGLRVLVVEDNVDAAEALSVLLEVLGYSVGTVHDGPSAVAMIRDTKPDVAFVDLALPGMNGNEVARALRSDPPLPTTLIALTGYGGDRDRQEAADAGFSHFLVKPVAAETIEALLCEIARRDDSAQ
jgi:CheY-like chemotaxis protein